VDVGDVPPAVKPPPIPVVTLLVLIAFNQTARYIILPYPNPVALFGTVALPS